MRKFINRKGYQSVDVLIATYKNCKRIYIFANKPRSVHDSRLIKEFPLINTYIISNWFSKNQKVLLLDDSGYPLCKNFITTSRICGNSDDLTKKSLTTIITIQEL